SDMKHPCLESAVNAKRAAVFQNAEENVLYEILRNASAGGHSRKVVKQRSMIAVEQDSEFGKIAISNRPHEGFVGFNHSVCKNCRFVRRLPGNTKNDWLLVHPAGFPYRDPSKLCFAKSTGTNARCGFRPSFKIETCLREGPLRLGEGAAKRRVRGRMGPHSALRAPLLPVGEG